MKNKCLFKADNDKRTRYNQDALDRLFTLERE